MNPWSDILADEIKKLADYIVLVGLEIPERKPPHKHVGAIIVDAVLQVGHQWKTHVGRRVSLIMEKYPGANTFVGLATLLKTEGPGKLLDWNGRDEQRRFIQTIEFFRDEQVDTFEELRKWLELDINRDRLVTNSPRADKAHIDRVGDATADYYRVLVGLPDSVKVDTRVKAFLSAAGIGSHQYKDMRTVVQLAARELGRRPIDLDAAIWNYQMNRPREGGKAPSKVGKAHDINRRWMCEARRLCSEQGLMNECADVEDMDWPATWHLERGGNGGKPKWWFNPRAVKEAFMLLWEKKSTSAPTGWKRPSRSRSGTNAFSNYLETPEGMSWRDRRKPDWL